MEGGAIVESQISSSSVHYGVLGLQRWGPELARLNNQGIVNAWTSASHDRNPWIEINMQKKMRLTGIITQGASRMGAAEYIKAFKVASSLDGIGYVTYKGDGVRRDKVFVGNTDNDSTKTNLFDPPIVAQYIRIIPMVCRRACTLRMELLSASSTFRTWGIDTFTWHPQFARLDKAGKTNAWSPAQNNRSEWIQVQKTLAIDVDLGKTKQLTGIITQGAKDFGVVQFVSEFKVAYSNDGESWIIPWEWHERITLRMELLGCDD
ncbi:hypothetical protein XENOCAPTIV_021290 [Xenoophorus captivus]|uniref:F5/8 type C domain-containing protein n=1 Tax=Xenoophorus captivus TaxID=1517983 RepID=A0ABV0Q5P8_9TELE